MGIFQAAFLGLLQGLTEFFPVSSSGHLVIGQKLLRLEQPPVLFDILVHLGTLLALIVYFRNKLFKFYKNFENLKLIFIGSLPAALIGFFLNDYLESFFDSLAIVGFALFITAGLLFSTFFISRSVKNLNQLNWRASLRIGFFQALALFPGISRSGSTIVAGLWQKLDRKAAFDFSFYLGMPAMVGAVLMQVSKFSQNNGQLGYGLIGMVTAALFGFLTLNLLEKAVVRGKLIYFGFYCLFLGLAILLPGFI